MRKKLLYFSFACGVIYSCNKSTSTAFTNATMKPWFDTNCAACHKSGASYSSNWKYDPTDDQTIQKHISELYGDVITKRSMPQGGGMPQSERDKFKAWFDAGHPSN